MLGRSRSRRAGASNARGPVGVKGWGGGGYDGIFRHEHNWVCEVIEAKGQQQREAKTRRVPGSCLGLVSGFTRCLPKSGLGCCEMRAPDSPGTPHQSPYPGCIELPTTLQPLCGSVRSSGGRRPHLSRRTLLNNAPHLPRDMRGASRALGVSSTDLHLAAGCGLRVAGCGGLNPRQYRTNSPKESSNAGFL